MSPDTAVTTAPPEIFNSIELLRVEMGKLQRELSQALGVWQSTLAGEKQQFDELLKHKEAAWLEQEDQWARQSQAYEARLQDLHAEFEARLKESEEQAARALSDLDEAWRREKLDWKLVTPEEWHTQRRDLEAKVESLELQAAETERARAAEREQYETRLRQTQQQEPNAGLSPSTVKALESQVLEFQQNAASLQDRAARSEEVVLTCLHTLDQQITLLYELICSGPARTAAKDASDIAS